MIEAASERYPNCEFQIGDFCDLQFPDRYFSCIFCMAAFQHIPLEDNHAFNTLRGFHRVLRENGILMLNVQLYRETGFEPDGRFTQGYNDKSEAVKLLNRAGFDVLKTHEWTLESGKNSFQRDVELNFCDFIARKNNRG